MQNSIVFIFKIILKSAYSTSISKKKSIMKSSSTMKRLSHKLELSTIALRAKTPAKVKKKLSCLSITTSIILLLSQWF